MKSIPTPRVKRAHLLIPLLMAVLGWTASAQAASKNDLETNGFNCAPVGGLPNIKPATRCEKCETNPQNGTVRCDVYYCDESGANCHPQATHATADLQEADLEHPLVGLGDINADAVADIAVGDPAHGQIVVLSGAGDGVLATLKSENLDPLSLFGRWFTGIEDRNGDAVADLVVKDSANGNFSFFSGLDGTKLTSEERADIPNEEPLMTTLPEMGRVAGDAVVGDLNKDGVADLAIVDPSQGQVLVFSGADSSLVTILPVPGLLDPVNTRDRSVTTSALIGASCVERSKYVQSGSWRTLETLWNVAARGHFRLPPGAQIKVRRGVGWFGWDTQKQTLNGETTKILSVDKSYIPSRMQMKVSQSTYVTYTYCPVGP
jgi:hypothetical protein